MVNEIMSSVLCGFLVRVQYVAMLLVLGVFLAAPAQSMQQLQVIGEAREQGTGQVLYREYYRCGEEGLQCTVEYRDLDGQLITRKALDYTAGPHTPRVSIEDFRHGQSVTLAREEEENLVVDAGFDNFVRSRWAQLSAGETVKFRFLVVGANKPYKMRAQRSAAPGCDAEHLCVRVEIDSWLLGLVAPTIELVYSRSQRQLMRFSGTSNIRSVDDRAQQVHISYRYDNLAELL